MYRISFKNFRGFQNQPMVKLRPITLLVGENSAGKSSFLAGMKYAHDFFHGFGAASFNNDPFQLGTFSQIAHFRGGRGGRARDFRIDIQTELPTKTENAQNKSRRLEASLVFGSVDSQAQLTALRFSSGSQSLEISSNSAENPVEYHSKAGKRMVLPSGSNSRLTKVDLGRFWTFILQSAVVGLTSPSKINEKSEGPEFSDELILEISDFHTCIEGFSRELERNIQATSAIRMKPSRTYTPGVENRDGEGSHVPFEIAKLYRSRSQNRSKWLNLKSSFEKFGSSSGMFKEISIKSFGQTTSDPFQIQFSSDGPKTNIVDLGYGTSQVLPILYGVNEAPERSIFLVQQPEVHLHAKAQASLGQYFVETFAEQNKRFVLETHSDFIVDRVRNGIAKKTIRKEDVSILFFRRRRLENHIVEIELDDLGDPVKPPEDFRSFFVDEQMKMLGF